MAFFHKKYFYYSVFGKILNVVWNENAKNITEKVFLKEIDRLAKLISEISPEKIFGNMVNLSELISEEGQEKYLKKMIPAFKTASLKKLAVLTNEDLFQQIFVSHLLEEEMKQIPFEAKYFQKMNAAEEWLAS
jgi:hypothetical protein